jgi:chloramphenicol-sensitive protein RarD
MASATALEWTLVVGTGVVTTVPLVLFGVAARRLPLSMVGLMQYLTPTMQLLVGVLLFHEPFGTDRAWGFSLVWAGLAAIALEAWGRGRRVRSGPG